MFVGGRMKNFEKYINTKDLLNKYEFHNYGHALEILYNAFPSEWSELQDSLCQLQLSLDDIKKAGGNESPIPKKFDDVLYPYGWREIRISGDLIVKKYPRQTVQRRGRFADEPFETEIIEGYVDGHNIDFLKNRVAFDLEWNSKDQTFDRDLLAMRTYFDCGLKRGGNRQKSHCRRQFSWIFARNCEGTEQLQIDDVLKREQVIYTITCCI